MIDAVVLGCGPIRTGKGVAALFIGVHILGKIWPAGGPNWTVYRGPKNQTYHNQPSEASLCSANWLWDGTAALFVAMEIRGNIRRSRGVEGMANW